MVLKHNSEEKVAFLLSVSKGLSQLDFYTLDSVVATTRWNGTRDMLTSAKLSVGYLVVGITRELNKEPSLY